MGLTTHTASNARDIASPSLEPALPHRAAKGTTRETAPLGGGAATTRPPGYQACNLDRCQRATRVRSNVPTVADRAWVPGGACAGLRKLQPSSLPQDPHFPFYAFFCEVATATGEISTMRTVIGS